MIQVKMFTVGPIYRQCHADDAGNLIALEFDQPVVWDDLLASQFYLDDAGGVVVGGMATDNILALALK